jgi:pimeloyl-ACP methyl ester carboxylesterase
MADDRGRDHAQYRTAYDAVLAQWPVAVESADLQSPYGTTHVNICGPRDGAPLLLLHSRGATSTVWFANVAALSQAHRVYAVDTIGDAGRSVHSGRPVDNLAAFMDWLDRLLGALNLDSVSLGGHSYGSWLALNYALHAPSRVRRLVLLDPTDCFTGLRLSYRLRAVPLFVRPSVERVRAFLKWEAAGMPIDPAWLTLMSLSAEVPAADVVMPRRPAPDRLRTLTAPTLLLLAEKSRAHDIRKVANIARESMPHLVTAVLPGVSHHTVPTEHARHLNRELQQFLDGTRLNG